MHLNSSYPAGRAVAPTRAAWRLVRLVGLIASGVYTVRRRFPTMAQSERDAEARRWSQRVLRTLQVEVALTGTLSAATRMLVGNHVSWLDVLVVFSEFPQARFVAKSEVRQWPAIGEFAAGTGSLFLDRGRPRDAQRLIEQVTASMVEGGLVAVFAEGTTTDGRTVLPFRAALLQAASDTGLPVQPMALRYSEAGMRLSRSVPYIGEDTLLQSLWRLCRARGVAVSLKVLPPRETGQTDRRSLAHALHADVRAALDV